MRPDDHHSRPAPEELGGFADGELPPECRDRVEAWLRHHPEAVAEVESLRRLTVLYVEHGPPEPATPAWDALWQRVEARLPAPSIRRGRRWPLLWAVGLAAAGLLGAVLLARTWWAPAPVDPNPVVKAVVDEGVLPVATDNDVTVIAMDPADDDALAVQPPMRSHDPMDFAAPGDFNVVRMDPSPNDGQVALLEEGAVPMIMAPRAMSDDSEP